MGVRTNLVAEEISKQSGATLITGGSTAFGAGVKQDDLYTTGFDNVFAAGVGGYTFANEFSLMKDVYIQASTSIYGFLSLVGMTLVGHTLVKRVFGARYVLPSRCDLRHRNLLEDTPRTYQKISKIPSYIDYPVKTYWLVSYGYYKMEKLLSSFWIKNREAKRGCK